MVTTEDPQTPSIAFSFHPATAELTEWCTDLVYRCLLRRVLHTQKFRDAFCNKMCASYNLIVLHNHRKRPVSGI